MNLQRNPNSNTFCVPAALALLLEVPVDKAVELLKEELGDVEITGVYYPVILKILKNHKYDFFHNSNSYGRDETNLIVFHGHVGVWKDQKYFDNHFPNGISYVPRGKVEAYYLIVPPSQKESQ